MKITVDLDPKIVWQLEAEAERRQIGTGAVLGERLTARKSTAERAERIRNRVQAGMCDADIAADLNELVATIAAARRRLGLPANPRRHGRAA